ncbi:hypothetical protein [Streptomyces sp. NPDC056154]|uniref:hypothetical protein n=1 Tax=unclassified Streptomyces TaxID=2593676 RepID=UPI0035DA6062
MPFIPTAFNSAKLFDPTTPEASAPATGDRDGQARFLRMIGVGQGRGGVVLHAASSLSAPGNVE